MKNENKAAEATARPWDVRHNLRQPIITNGHKTLAEIVNHEISNLVTRQEAEANAALIVTCVNEHDALIALEKATEEMVKSHGSVAQGTPLSEVPNGYESWSATKDALATLSNLRKQNRGGK